MKTEKFNMGDKVKATITKNGYFINCYIGVVVGFTKDGKVKVNSYRGTKCHALQNVVNA